MGPLSVGPLSVGATIWRVETRDGIVLRAVDWAGDPARTPVLCLSGICRTADDFAELAARQAGLRRVVALDYVGHGESDRAPEVARYTPQAVLSDILDVCAAMHLPRVVSVGTSFGGLMTMFLSLVRPGLLRGALLNDIGPRVETDGMGIVSGFAGHDPGFAAIEDAVAYLRNLFPTMPIRDEAGWLRFAGLTYRAGGDGRLHPRWDTRIAQAFAAGGGGGDFGHVFRGLSAVPTALVWAEASDILRWPTVSRMLLEKPDLDLIRFPGAGHAPTLNEPEIVRAVDAFLEGIA
ncbi:alpha/beta fold hydrolase [Roseomonas sp. CCTCC AB2023176]|uniref:alpha/beta fold hydrolase n=1 Tax=Roseomonas sp. CCTCC AB2023176 TaxID=3342640 RepID=UPI0035DD7E6E